MADLGTSSKGRTTAKMIQRRRYPTNCIDVVNWTPALTMSA